jgi:hypothetical protein
MRLRLLHLAAWVLGVTIKIDGAPYGATPRLRTGLGGDGETYP